ncbi:MAG: hypothetical protein ACK5OW_00440 [bacterium]|jgi:hypothetical protein
MKDLIRKILKENEDEFGWVEADEHSIEQGKKIVYEKWRQIEMDFGADLEDVFDELKDFGVYDPKQLLSMAEILYDQFQEVHDNGHRDGYDSGMDNCTCDGCCDDYIWYETHEEEVEEAREEGYERGKEESESEIEELKSRIEELESQLNENINKKNTKRI